MGDKASPWLNSKYWTGTKLHLLGIQYLKQNSSAKRLMSLEDCRLKSTARNFISLCWQTQGYKSLNISSSFRVLFTVCSTIKLGKFCSEQLRNMQSWNISVNNRFINRRVWNWIRRNSLLIRGTIIRPINIDRKDTGRGSSHRGRCNRQNRRHRTWEGSISGNSWIRNFGRGRINRRIRRNTVWHRINIDRYSRSWVQGLCTLSGLMAGLVTATAQARERIRLGTITKLAAQEALGQLIAIPNMTLAPTKCHKVW